MTTGMCVINRADLLPWSPRGDTGCSKHWEQHLSCTISTAASSSGNVCLSGWILSVQMHTLVGKCSSLLLGLCAALQCVETKQGTKSMEGKTCLTLVLLLQKTTQHFPHLWDQPYFLRLQQKLNTKRDPGRMSIQFPGVGLRGIGYLCVRGSVLVSALGLFHRGLQSD